MFFFFRFHSIDDRIVYRFNFPAHHRSSTMVQRTIASFSEMRTLLQPLLNLTIKHPIEDPATKILQTIVALRQIEERAQQNCLQVDWMYVITFAETVIDTASASQWRTAIAEPTLLKFIEFLRDRAQWIINVPARFEWGRRKQFARKSTGGRLPRKQIASKNVGRYQRPRPMASKSVGRRQPQ